MTARVSDDRLYNPVYDFIRGLCALVVFIVHLESTVWILFGFELSEDTYFLNSFASLSVEIFFALSGVLLGPILYKQFQYSDYLSRIKVFLLRRWYRTLPVYFLGLLASLWIFWIQNEKLPEHLFHYFVFLQNFLSANDSFYAVSWSLAIEEIFYIVFPALTLIFFLILKKVDQAFILSVLLICAFSFVMRHYQLQNFEYWEWDLRRPTLLRLDSIAAGVLVGIFFHNIRLIVFLMATLILTAIHIYFHAQWYDIENTANTRIILQAVYTVMPWATAIFVVYLAQSWKLKKGIVTVFLADISYPLYILHIPMIKGFFFIWGGYTFERLVLFFWIMLFISYLVYRYIEVPVLKRRPGYATKKTDH